MLRLLCVGHEFESRGGIITFYLFYLLRFLSHFSLYYLSLIQLTSISVIIYMLTLWILYFRAIMGLPHTHALCTTQDVLRYVKLRPWVTFSDLVVKWHEASRGFSAYCLPWRYVHVIDRCADGGRLCGVHACRRSLAVVDRRKTPYSSLDVGHCRATHDVR